MLQSSPQDVADDRWIEGFRSLPTFLRGTVGMDSLLCCVPNCVMLGLVMKKNNMKICDKILDYLK